jgi:hypothetical protein
MEYSFEIVGVSSVLSFFSHQQAIQSRQNAGAEYLGSYCCTLDAFIASMDQVPLRRNWNMDQVVESVIQFWWTNAESVKHWQRRLADSGQESLLVTRVADVNALKAEFELLLSE